MNAEDAEKKERAERRKDTRGELCWGWDCLGGRRWRCWQAGMMGSAVRLLTVRG